MSRGSKINERRIAASVFRNDGQKSGKRGRKGWMRDEMREQEMVEQVDPLKCLQE